MRCVQEWSSVVYHDLLNIQKSNTGNLYPEYRTLSSTILVRLLQDFTYWQPERWSKSSVYSFTSMMMIGISVDLSESEYQYFLNLVNAR